MRQRSVHALALIASLSVPSVALAEDVRVFILAGQSNAVGYGEGADLPAALANQTDVLYDFFNPASRSDPDYANTASLDWEPLTPKGVGQWYGPEITFADQIKAALPDRRTAVVKVAAGGTNIREHWERGLPSDQKYPDKSQLFHSLMGTLDSAEYSEANGNPLLYASEPTRLDNALDRLATRGDNVEFGCFLWVQGENEAGWNAAFTYEEKLTGLIAAVREDLGTPELPFILGRTALQQGQAQGGPSPDANLAAVRAAQEAVAAADPFVEWVDMDDLPGAGDSFHFATEGYQLLGERLATACADLVQPGSGGSGAGGSGSGAGGEGGAPSGGASAGGAESGGGGSDTSGPTSTSSGANSDSADGGGCSHSGQSPSSHFLLAAVGLLGVLGLRRRPARR